MNQFLRKSFVQPTGTRVALSTSMTLTDHFPDWHDIGMSREARDADGRDADVSLHHISDLLHRLDERLHPPHDDKLDDSGRRRTDQARVGRHFRHHHSQHRQDHAAHIGHFRMRGTDRGIGRPLIRFVGEVVGLIREPVGLGMRREIVGLVWKNIFIAVNRRNLPDSIRLR